MKNFSLLRLFKGYEGNKRAKKINEVALKYGIVIPANASEEVVNEAIRLYGKDGFKLNQTFHKSINTVKETDIETLVLQQIVHYMTTYGFEEAGIFNEETVYIPKEELKVPELDEDVELIVIKPMNSNEISEKLMTLLTSGIALSKDSVNDVLEVSDYINKEKFDEITNREVKTALYDKYNITPKNAEEFFKLLIYKTTFETLKINNDELIERIKESNKAKALQMFESYITANGYEKLAAIFLRNKDLFLAFKINNSNGYSKTLRVKMNKTINKISKLAKKCHKPLKRDILGSLTDSNYEVNLESLPNLLDNITIFREIRILNGITYRLDGSENIVYKIRNGKSYAKKLPTKTNDEIIRLTAIEKVVRDHLVARLTTLVKDKKIYIPKNVVYAAPTSEKRFNGNFPEGSYIELPRKAELVYGISWNNIPRKGEDERVDIDLKQLNNSEIFGWDASYKSEEEDIYFSGDMTDAPNPVGASEMFYVGKKYGYGAFMVTANLYTNNREKVPFKFTIAEADKKPEERTTYILNPNKILTQLDLEFDGTNPQKVIGFIVIGDTIKFYLSDFTNGNSISSYQDEVTLQVFDYLKASSKTQLKLNDLLIDAGAILVDTPDTKEDDEEIIIDLSPNKLTKDVIISLLTKKD